MCLKIRILLKNFKKIIKTKIKTKLKQTEKI